MFWLCRDLGYKQYHGVSIIFIKRYLILFCVTLPIAILMMIVESDITFEEALNIDVLNYKIIPTINQNIGLGSDQLLVNWNWKLVTILGHIMILFPILGVYTMVEWIRIICKFKSKKKNASKLSSIHVFMNLSLIFSTGLLILSVKLTTYDFLPLIIPFVYINGETIIKSSRKTVKTTNYAFKLWICINMLLGLFNGFLHEGGVLPATMYLSKRHQEHQIYPVDIHIVTSHVPPIPQMLFMQYEHEQEIFLHEYGKSPITTVIEQIATLRYDAFVTGNEYQLYFLIPSYKHNELISALQDFNRVDIKLETSFYPHVTVEAFDTFKLQNYQFSNVTDLIYATSLTFNLDLYAIQP
ncbi:GPI mannosyltransferase 4-like [Atheta coriaria]|uniref:GPI mannosyltransferase 4-like n=1 Tax=Dalotia coriaria TaxID=877792 RepID=UPI0031F37E14